MDGLSWLIGLKEDACVQGSGDMDQGEKIEGQGRKRGQCRSQWIAIELKIGRRGCEDMLVFFVDMCID